MLNPTPTGLEAQTKNIEDLVLELGKNLGSVKEDLAAAFPKGKYRLLRFSRHQAGNSPPLQ